ncbi:tail fiber domain-containing protein, partial [Arthrospira platensis SPKY2]
FSKEKIHTGLIAQEVQQYYPEAVEVVEKDNTDDEEINNQKIDYLTILYEKLVPLLVKSIQELSMKVNELEKKLDVLSK